MGYWSRGPILDVRGNVSLIPRNFSLASGPPAIIHVLYQPQHQSHLDVPRDATVQAGTSSRRSCYCLRAESRGDAAAALK